MQPDFEELIKTGAIDITTSEAVENESDRAARAAEPGAYALTYEESVTVLRAHNIIETTLIQNDFVELDKTTRTKTLIFNPESTQKILEAFVARNLDPDDLHDLAERVLCGNWFTLALSAQYLPGKGKGPGYYLIANVNGKRDEGILKIEDYPAIYEESSRAEQRDALNLPSDTAYLFSIELDTLKTLRQVCDTQFFIEEKVGYLAPYSPMPNPASFGVVSQFINNPHVRTSIAGQEDRWERGEEENEYVFSRTTRNVTTTLRITDPLGFFDIDSENTTGKRRRGSLSGILKAWRFALQKLMQQSSNRAVPPYITIDLEEMAERGHYANKDTAYRSLATMVKRMGFFHIEEEITPKKGAKRGAGGILFYSYERNGKTAHIFVNQNFGFEFFRQKYTYFPTSWGFTLDGNAFALTDYIFSIMRQRAEEVTRKGKFTIKISTVCEKIGLRSVEDVRENCNRRYNDFIKKPLIQAITEANAAAKTDKEIQGRFKIVLKTADTADIEKWMAGCLEVTATEEYTRHLIGITDAQQTFAATYKEERIRQAAKRRANPKRKGLPGK